MLDRPSRTESAALDHLVFFVIERRGRLRVQAFVQASETTAQTANRLQDPSLAKKSNLRPCAASVTDREHISCRPVITPRPRFHLQAVPDAAQRWAYNTEWTDKASGVTWAYTLLHWPADQEVEMVSEMRRLGRSPQFVFGSERPASAGPNRAARSECSLHFLQLHSSSWQQLHAVPSLSRLQLRKRRCSGQRLLNIATTSARHRAQRI